MSVRMCFPKTRDRFEWRMSQMDSDGSTGENHLIDLGTCSQASASGLPKKRLRIERTPSKFDTNGNTSESHIIDFGA